MTERLLRKEQAREFLGISRPTLDRMIDRGEIAIIRVSLRALRISEAELRRLVEQRTERRGS
jgi:excisionase family DNA binding protein